MVNLSPSELDGFAREVAGQVSQGYSFDQVAGDLDLAIHELDQIFDSEEFKKYLESRKRAPHLELAASTGKSPNGSTSTMSPYINLLWTST